MSQASIERRRGTENEALQGNAWMPRAWFTRSLEGEAEPMDFDPIEGELVC